MSGGHPNVPDETSNRGLDIARSADRSYTRQKEVLQFQMLPAKTSACALVVARSTGAFNTRQEDILKFQMNAGAYNTHQENILKFEMPSERREGGLSSRRAWDWRESTLRKEASELPFWDIETSCINEVASRPLLKHHSSLKLGHNGQEEDLLNRELQSTELARIMAASHPRPVLFMGYVASLDILSMPDRWEYPFFAAWDTAFHCIPLAVVDPAFAKKQLDLMTREWYMKPDGQILAYEWNFSDVNPPRMHGKVFKIERKLTGKEDLAFLEHVFQKLLLNFTWWVNCKDKGKNRVFEGGFLGLDNIVLSTVWNRCYRWGSSSGRWHGVDGILLFEHMPSSVLTIGRLNMALELAKHNPVYEDIASKFFEMNKHFIFIADATTFKEGDNEFNLRLEQDGMYYDAIHFGPGNSAVACAEFGRSHPVPSTLNRFPGFKKRVEWFLDNRPEVSARNMANMKASNPANSSCRFLAHFLVVNLSELLSVLQICTTSWAQISHFSPFCFSKLYFLKPEYFRVLQAGGVMLTKNVSTQWECPKGRRRCVDSEDIALPTHAASGANSRLERMRIAPPGSAPSSAHKSAKKAKGKRQSKSQSGKEEPEMEVDSGPAPLTDLDHTKLARAFIA
ncbi:hypothetical protein DFH07DRAFT_1035976 [Mycena maculata]|uniref:PGAP2IP C-terminal nuclease-like domain-containing protein n=1 Tax=Mycena maculata TaxID=230809 RepID=A0AAD7K3W2_9AGAR|nr:hypothetical protein DFH07DRAFT_1035976 [Mycena maculata]